MVVRCYCCKKRFKSNLDKCPHCNFRNLKFHNWLPEELKIKHGENHAPIRASVTISEVTQYAKDAAKACEFELTSLKVSDNFEGVMEVLQPDDNDFHKLEINFNSNFLRRITSDELRSVLIHEILHPVTMQESSKTAVVGENPIFYEFQQGIQTAYDEMINYKEYAKRFPYDKSLHSARKKLFTNFSMILLDAKHILEDNLISPDHPSLFVSVLAIYEDAVLYFFEHSEIMQQWVDENSAQALFQILKWIHEDFIMIQENISSRDEMREMVFLTYYMLPTIMIDKIFEV